MNFAYLPPDFGIYIDLDDLLENKTLLMQVSLMRYANVQPSELDRFTLRQMDARTRAVNFLIAEEEKAKMKAQVELLQQAKAASQQPGITKLI